MRNYKSSFSRWPLTGAALFSLLAFGPCTEKITLPNSLAGFKVTVTEISGAIGGSGTFANPFDYPDGEILFTVDVQAYDNHGQMLEQVEGEVAVKVTSGDLLSLDTTAHMQAGEISGLEVRARRLMGPATVWIEDIHLVDDELIQSEGSFVQLRRPMGSWATGISRQIHFKKPTLGQIQRDPQLEAETDIYESPLAGRFVEIDCREQVSTGPFQDEYGKLLVTGIVNEGFFVTDLAEPVSGFNHLYVYNYSFPEHLQLGDRIARLTGTSQDFSGCTQISFPSYLRVEDKDGDSEPFRVAPDQLDTLVPPVLIDQALCDEKASNDKHLCGHSKRNWSFEALESGRVRIENFRTPDVIVNCDFDGDGQVVADWMDAADPEAICSVACLKRNPALEFVVEEIITSQAAHAEVILDPAVICPWEEGQANATAHCQRVRIGPEQVCTELTTLRGYGQWVVALGAGAGPLINVISQQNQPDYDPAALENLGRTLPYLQGNLRQVRAARPRWMVLVGAQATDLPPSWQARSRLP